MELTEEQKAVLKNLSLLALFYYGNKLKDRYLKLALLGYAGFVIVKGMRAGDPSVQGYGFHIDTDLAIDMVFPKMSDEKKAYAKLAARNLMSGFKGRQT